MTNDAARQLSELLSLWFGDRANLSDDPVAAVRSILRFNRPVAQTFDGAVEVLVVEQQGVWLWGRTADGRYVERENETGAPWRQLLEDEYEFWLHHAAFEAATDLVASRSAQMFDAPTVARIKSALTPLPCGVWTWPGTSQSVHSHGASVVMICEGGDDFWVVASAPSEEDLDWLDDLDLSWDESDTRSSSAG